MQPRLRRALDDISADHRAYYDGQNLTALVVGAGVAGALANTGADEHAIRDLYQENVRQIRTDEYFEKIHEMKVLGEGQYALPIYALAAAGGWIAEGHDAVDVTSRWGEESLRAVLVGAPPLLALQRITGGSRPGERPGASNWRPLADDNGVSGHAFMGAVPLVTAAMLCEDPWLQAACYAGSGLAGLSRVNDDSHFASQVLLGWWMAVLAVHAVHRTESDWGIRPVAQLTGDGYTGVRMEHRW